MLRLRAKHGDWDRFDIHLEVLQHVLTLIPVAAAHVRNFSSIEERHYGLQQGSILDSEEGHNQNGSTTSTRDMIYITFSDVTGFFDRHFLPSLLSMLSSRSTIYLSQVITTAISASAVSEWCQPSFSKKTNHVCLAFTVSMSRQFTLHGARAAVLGHLPKLPDSP
jgi:hypothetical protein